MSVIYLDAANMVHSHDSRPPHLCPCETAPSSDRSCPAAAGPSLLPTLLAGRHHARTHVPFSLAVLRAWPHSAQASGVIVINSVISYPAARKERCPVNSTASCRALRSSVPVNVPARSPSRGREISLPSSLTPQDPRSLVESSQCLR